MSYRSVLAMWIGVGGLVACDAEGPVATENSLDQAVEAPQEQAKDVGGEGAPGDDGGTSGEMTEQGGAQPQPPPGDVLPELPAEPEQLWTCPVPADLPDFIDLPARYVDTDMPEQGGALIRVAAGQSIQEALNAAQPGDTIELEAGASWVEQVNLPTREPGDGWIVIRSSAMDQLPAEGARVTPEHAMHMPKVLAPSGSTRALVANQRAHHYRIMGVEFGVAPGENTSFGVIDLGRFKDGDSWIPMEDRPHHIVLDRVYLHGIAEPEGEGGVGTKYGVLLSGADMAVIDSHISDIKKVGQDNQAITSFSGSGPYKIVNNYLAAGAENILFGGGDTPDASHNASDVEICFNHIHKPLDWYDPSYRYNSRWIVKNSVEFKHGIRVVVSANVIENNWASAQTGWTILVRSTDQGGGDNNLHQKSEDLVFAYNHILNVTHGFDVNGRGSASKNAGPTEDIYFGHNVFERMGPDSSFGGNGWLFNFDSDPRNIHVVHNTALNGQTYLLTNCTGARDNCSGRWDDAVINLQVRDNIMSYGVPGYGVHGPSGETDEAQFASATDEASTLERNVLAFGQARQYPSVENFIADDFQAVGFVDLEAGDLRLAPDSPYKGMASDETDPGADVARVRTLTAGVR